MNGTSAPARWKYLPLAALLAAAFLQAQPPEESLSKVMKWRSIGPYRGGRVTAVAGVPRQPAVYYMGATGGGVWKTENAGITWRPISDGYFKTGSVGAIAVADSDPNIIYVGMGEACLRGNISHGDGVYKSTDAGKTWTNIGLRDTQQIGKISADPQNPDLVYVAAVGHPYGPNAERGVFRTRDGGKNWDRVLYVNDKTGAVDLAMDLHNPRVLYATTWQVLRTPWGINSLGPGSRIYKSADGGNTWTELKNGLPKGDKGKIGITVSPVDSNRVWATVEAEDGGVYRSDDAGQTWSLMNDSFELRGRQYYYGHIYADPQDRDTVYTFAAKYFFKSRDGGRTWEKIQTPHGDYHDLWIDPHNHLRMVNGNDGGATVTFDGGSSWSTLDNQATAQFYEVITDNQFPYRVYGSQQDNTTVSIASRTDGAGIGPSDWYAVAGGESGYIAPDPRDPEIVYGGSYFGMLTGYDHHRNRVRNISIWPDYPGGRTAAEMRYRFQWTYPIVIPALEPDTIYAGANVLFKSTNQGQSWEVISPDLTHDDKAREAGGRLEEYYSTIFAIAPSRREKGVIWAGSDDGLVHLTRNGGKNWENVTPPGMPPWSRINNIEASPNDAATAYLAVNRYQLDDLHPYIYKTTDYGKTWKLLRRGIPADAFVRSVREDQKGLLYAGTETGVYVSLDNGENWQSLQLNLPAVPITDLAVKDDDLVAATQGRSFWILDDLTLLQQLAGGAPQKAHLFRPRDVYWSDARQFNLPSYLPSGQNPRSGLVIYYYLPGENQQPVSLTFEEMDGKTIQAFSARGEPGGRAALPAQAGMNRFEWDLRYPDARGIEGGTFLAGGSLRGPLAVPGRYRVKLTAGDQSLSQEFEIKKDPRGSSTEQDYRKQFELLIRIRDKVSAADDAINEIRRTQEQIQAALNQSQSAAGNDAQCAARRKLTAELAAVLHDLWEPRFKGFDDQMLVFPLKLNNRIAALQGYVRGPYAVTDQDERVFSELAAELDSTLARLRKILDTDLPALEKLALAPSQPAR
jgi:photosystem II stability/assembly factor-like uncharacterized protein